MTPNRFPYRSSMGEFEVVPAYQYDALAARLAEAHVLLQDALLYGCNSKWAARLAAHLGTSDSAAERDGAAL